MSKYIELAKKLAALAERGVGGEKENAQRMLDDLLEKHHLTIEDIESDITSVHYFSYTNDTKWLFFQIVSSVDYQLTYGDTYKRNTIWMKLTAEKAMEIEGKYAFYKNHFVKEFKKFKMAFIMSNRLFSNRPPTQTIDDMTPEEQAERKAASLMSMGLNGKRWNKELAEHN